LLLSQWRSLREFAYFTLNKKRFAMLAVLVRYERAVQLRNNESVAPGLIALHAVRVIGCAQQVFTGASLARTEVAVGKFAGDSGFSALVEGIATYRAFGSHIWFGVPRSH